MEAVTLVTYHFYTTYNTNTYTSEMDADCSMHGGDYISTQNSAGLYMGN